MGEPVGMVLCAGLGTRLRPLTNRVPKPAVPVCAAPLVAWSLALLGAGHLVGLSVGMAMLLGLVIAWGVAVPILTSMQPAAAGIDLATHTLTIWRTQVRFIGAGAIGIAAIYTLAKLAKPVMSGLVSTLAASRAAATSDDRDRDISPPWIFALTAGCLIIAAWLAFSFAKSTVLASNAITLTLIAVPFFVAGLGLLILGVAFAMMEMYRALDPIELESRFVTEMVESIDRLAD